MKKIIVISFIIINSIILIGCNNQIKDNNIPDIEPVPSFPTTCVEQTEGIPVITSISSNSGTINSKIELKGCNFGGFEGDTNSWIENDKGEKAILYGEEGSNSKSIKFTLKSTICQTDTSYSGLECEKSLELKAGKYKIYVMPWGKVSNKVDFTINENYYDNLTYKNVINYIELNLTEIINDFSEKKPANSKWFADGYGFTSNSDVYVDFEDGHFLYRALLKCNNEKNIISCNAIAIFEKDKDWKVIQGVDTVKDDAIIYKWAKDYEWKR